MKELKSLIVYASKQGTTKDAAHTLSRKLNFMVDLFDCNKMMLQKAANQTYERTESVDLNDYKLIIIGTAMYMGAPLKPVKQFCIRNEKTLLRHDIAFFTCGIGTKQEDGGYLKNHLPPMLTQNAITYRHFGGEIKLDQMNLLERFAMNEYIKKNGPAPGINQAMIDDFCQELNDSIGKEE